MTKWLRDFRLMPIVLTAVGCLLALKVLGLMLDGGYTLGERLSHRNGLVVTTMPVSPTVQLQSPTSPLGTASGLPADAKRSWMQEMFKYPDITGSVGAAKPSDKKSAGAEAGGKESTDKKAPPTGQRPPKTKEVDGTLIPLNQTRPTSVAERALLKRLHDRRQELDARARELDLRESLLKAAEKKMKSEEDAQKADEAKNGAPGKHRADSDAARMKAVVTMYETMKPKDAARIFDRLDIKVLLEMARLINPRRMSEILAQMTPEAAERLTVELAAHNAGGSGKEVNPSSLPKIEGRPTGG
jgi:flagellar motility protein MotE (MotC chaperone)